MFTWPFRLESKSRVLSVLLNKVVKVVKIVKVVFYNLPISTSVKKNSNDSYDFSDRLNAVGIFTMSPNWFILR